MTPNMTSTAIFHHGGTHVVLGALRVKLTMPPRFTHFTATTLSAAGPHAALTAPLGQWPVGRSLS